MQQSPVRPPYEPLSELETQVPTSQRLLSKQRTRQKVMEAARALFSEHGYEAATIRDIARRAGMSTGAVFANFQDKADLFEAVVAEDFERVAEIMRQAADQAAGDPVEARLKAIFAAAYENGFTDVPLVQAGLAHSWVRTPSAENRGRSRVKMLLAIVGDALRDAAHKGEIRQDFDVRLVSEMLWDAYVSNYRRAAYDGWAGDRLQERLASQIAILLAGLKKD